MRLRYLVVAFVLGLAACNGSSSVPAPPGNPPTALKSTTALPGLTTGGSFTYDIGEVDPQTRRYYLADRTNVALDVLNADTGALVAQIKGAYAGNQASPGISGPDGVVALHGTSTVYVGDVNSVKVVDVAKQSTVTTIPIATSGFRTDEGCYDGDDGIVMFANPNDPTPFATWISSKTNAVLAKLPFAGSAGLEACVYDPGTKNFLLNNDGTSANPFGELDVVAAASVSAGTPAVSARYALPNQCSPTGMALGAGETLMIGCDPPAGAPVVTLFLNATTGAVLKVLTEVGGADQVAYDPGKRRFYEAARHMTANGIASASGPYTPVLGVIDGTSLTFLQNLPTGSNAHSVAVDSTTGNVFVPVPPTATSAGGIDIFN